MMNYRFKFTKDERIKFTGHLDIMQAFQRAIKRADLPISYSKGFNPHQHIAFALPLSLGYTSTGEYGDFRLTEDIEPIEVMERLNACMPDGLFVTELIRLKDNVKNTMASVTAAKYRVIFDDCISKEEIVENINGFFNQKEIVVMKKTKKNFKETDIKPDIMELYIIDKSCKAELGMIVSAGSTRNLKPESVAEGFCIFLRKEFNVYRTGFVREEMYMEENGKLIPLNFGVERE